MIPISYPKISIDSIQKQSNPDDYICIRTPKLREVVASPNIGLLAFVEPQDDIRKIVFDLSGMELNGSFHQDYIKSLTLFIEHRCNFHCDYCFVSEHKIFDNQKQHSIKLETVPPIISSFIEQIPNGAYASITLFGGEPLLHKDFLTILDIIEEERVIQGKDCDVIIFTNGSLIDDVFVMKIKDRKNFKIIVSIDGPPELNDLHRIQINKDSASLSTKNGLSKLDCIERDRIIGRITINDDMPLAKQRISYLIETVGLRNVTLEVAYNREKTGAYINRLENLSEELSEICDYYISQLRKKNKINIGIISEIVASIMSPKVPLKTNKVCPAGRTNLAIDSDGKRYPCHRQVDNPVRLKKDKIEPYQTTLADCDGCWAAPWCDKICPSIASDSNYNPDLIKAICDYNKKRILCSIDMILDLYNESNPNSKLWPQVELK